MVASHLLPWPTYFPVGMIPAVIEVRPNIEAADGVRAYHDPPMTTLRVQDWNRKSNINRKSTWVRILMFNIRLEPQDIADDICSGEWTKVYQAATITSCP